MVYLNVSLDGGATSTSNFTAASQSVGGDPYHDNTSPGAVILVVASFFALMFSVPVLVWHIKNRSLPASSMVFWIVLENIYNILNALIWPNDNFSTWWTGEGYCDIEIKLDIAASIGLLGSLCCILQALAKALDTDNARLMPTQAQRRRQLVLELLYCIGFPMLLATLHFVIQPFRYYVLAIAGCSPAFGPTWLSVTIFYIWPPVVCLINAYYAVVLIIRIRRYRRDFSSILTSSSSGLNKSRFLRLFAAAIITLCIVIPTQSYSLYRNLQEPITTFSWSEWHNPQTWQTIVFVPTYGGVLEDRWIRAGLALPVFLCFGWGRDAKTLYKSWALLLGLDRFFPSLRPPSSGSPSTGRKTLGTSTTLNSRTSTNPLLSKARSLFARLPFPTPSSASTSPSKPANLFTLSDTSSLTKPSPTSTSPFHSTGRAADRTIAAHDFALSLSLEPISSTQTGESPSRPSDVAAPTIPLRALAARAQRRQHRASPELPRRWDSLRSSSTTAVGSEESKGCKTSWKGGWADSKALSDSGVSEGGSVCGEEVEVEMEGGLGGEAGAGDEVEKEKKKGRGEGEVKMRWETAAQALREVEFERAYEEVVVGALV